MPTPVNDSRCTWKESSDRGLRDDNQDRAISIAPTEADLIRRKGVLLVVCDGVGAELGGKRAAELAADATLDAYYENTSIDAEKSLREAIASAHTAVQAEANMRKLQGMATTIVAAVVNKGKLHVAHVGDSRAYLLRDGRLIRLTQDHTSMSDAITAGTLTREDTRKISKQRAITRSLGTPKNTADVASRELRWGDRVLLCTDGLYDVLDDATIERTLKQQHNAERAVNALMKAAIGNNASGGAADNVSISVLNYGETAAAAGAGLPVKWLAAAVAGVLGLGLLGFALSRLLGGGADEPAVVAEASVPTAVFIITTATTPPQNSSNPSAPSSAGVKPEPPTATPEVIATAIAAVTPADQPTAGPQPTATLARPMTPTPQPRSSTAASNTAASQATPSAQTRFAGLTPNGLNVYANDRFGMELISTGYERWGDPQASSQCDGYYDLRPVYQFKLTVRVINTSNSELTGLSPQFFTSGGTPIVACHDGGGPLPNVPPGESRVVRLLAYLHEGQNAAALTLSAQGRRERACFVANKLARC